MNFLNTFNGIKEFDSELPIIRLIEKSKKSPKDQSEIERKIIEDSFATLEMPLKYMTLTDVIHQAIVYRASKVKPQKGRSPELFRSLVGNSRSVRMVRDMMGQVADSEATVLILGESGTGKEVVARNLHYNSTRRNRPFVPVNCGAIPPDLLESELFGHEKGAFTGAISARQGRFEMAESGTLFLDEIGDMSLHMQVKLLRVLQERTFERVGSNKSIRTNVRIVAATHRDLENLIEDGKFREDLFYRLNTVPIHLPALRERPEDIYLLFRKFAADFAAKYRMPSVKLTEEAVTLLTNYPWPGNIRQLKNVAEQISVIESERNINQDILASYLPLNTTTNLPTLYKNKEDADLSERDILYKILFDLKGDVTELKNILFSLVNNNTTQVGTNNDSLMQSVKNLYKKSEAENVTTPTVYKTQIIPTKEVITTPKEVEEESLSLADKEKELIIKALKKYSGKRKKAADELGISERTLYRKIKEYTIEN